MFEGEAIPNLSFDDFDILKVSAVLRYHLAMPERDTDPTVMLSEEEWRIFFHGKISRAK